MPYVYVRQQRAIHQQSLSKGLPSSVDESVVEYEVRRLELPIWIHKYFEPEHEV